MCNFGKCLSRSFTHYLNRIFVLLLVFFFLHSLDILVNSSCQIMARKDFLPFCLQKELSTNSWFFLSMTVSWTVQKLLYTSFCSQQNPELMESCSGSHCLCRHLEMCPGVLHPFQSWGVAHFELVHAQGSMCGLSINILHSAF
jgi:hypothetical protein